MTSINTVLTTSGNSVALRLPQNLLRMSGLNGNSKVMVSAKNNQIIITKSTSPREGWEDKIEALMHLHGDPSKEFEDMKIADNDGLDDLPWEGPSYEEWKKAHDGLS